MPGSLSSAVLHLRTARRLARRGGPSLRERLGPLDERLVFVVGSPRSGTTFLGRSIGSLPGFVDLGEVAPHKASVPELVALSTEVAARRIHRTLAVARRLGLVGGLRGVEQTPETVFVAEAAALAFPSARFVHIVRDGRDVACSLLDRGWLSQGRGGGDDAGLPYGAEPRFWVEPDRVEEFRTTSDARRAAWAWRAYVQAARSLHERAHEIRYERMVADPDAVAAELAVFLDAPASELARALRGAHDESVGRFRRDLTPEQLADVESEAGKLLVELSYLQVA
ncbi:MAG TPA: sulfotransferase [Gaiellaceae bacterium]|nr:sulfotransferase [Gaiellaceae bacterium]